MEKKSLLNILISFFLIISVLILIYTHYKSHIIYDSNRVSHYIIYYIISLSGVLFFSSIYFLNESLKENIIISFITLIFLLYSTELIFNYLNLKKKNDVDIAKDRRLKRAEIILEKYGVEVDTRSQLEVHQDLKKKGIDTHLLVTPYRMLGTDGILNYSWKEGQEKPKKFFPLSGSANKLTIGGAETGRYNIYKSDRYGFNNIDQEWDKKINTVIIGDSAIHAAYLPVEQGWAGNFKKLTNKPVLSLGIGNNGHLLNLATLIEYGKSMKPNIVLWVYVEENDLVELKNEIKSEILSKYLNENFDQNLIEMQDLIEKNYQIFVNKKIKENKIKETESELFSIENKPSNKFLSFVKLTKLRNYLFYDLKLYFTSRITNKTLSDFEKVLVTAKKTTESFNGEFYFIYLPATTRYLEDYKYNLKDNDYYRDEVLDIVKKLKIPLIDLYELHFKNIEDPLSTLSFRMHSHYNQGTLQDISKVILDFLNKNN
tara:strand:+ start:1053 stop:2510 length:1458 start_codon:yes stop_codon:yes gene_type:complete